MSRSSGRRSVSRSVSRRRPSTSGVTKTWPLNRGYASPYFDPFPNQMRNILRYSTTINLDPVAGLPQHYLFRATSIFDPDATGTGHQPYGHDTLASIYNHYQVDECIITMTSTSVGTNGIFGITVTDDSSVNSDFDTVREQKGATFASIAASPNPVRVMSKYVRKATFPVETALDTVANYGANPTENTFFDVWAEGNLPGNNPTAMSFVITLSYKVRSWELRDLDQS